MIGWTEDIPVTGRSPEPGTVSKRARRPVDQKCPTPVIDTGGHCLLSWRSATLTAQLLERLFDLG